MIGGDYVYFGNIGFVEMGLDRGAGVVVMV